MSESKISAATELLQSALSYLQSDSPNCEYTHKQISDGSGSNFRWVHNRDCHRCNLEARIEAYLREQD